MAERIGLTMRVSGAEGYTEWRDALAQDWLAFMARVLPEVDWIPVPNLEDGVVSYARKWGLDGFILTGGNDVGEHSRRDRTEEALLHLALEDHFPVFGICRGLQFLQKFFGGDLQPCRRESHVGVFHCVRRIDCGFNAGSQNGTREVNSFHGQAVALDGLASPLRAFTVTDDGWAEGIYHPELPWAAVQWHPERTHPLDAEDRRLIRRVFGWEEK